MGACGAVHETATSDESIRGGHLDRAYDAVGMIGVAKTRDSPDIAWICSATLISPSTVLTAAHCLYGTNGRRIGTSRLRFAVNEEIFYAKSAHVARSYYPFVQVDQDDLAMLRLHETPEVEPIPIAEVEPVEDAPAVVVGYGATSADSPSSTYGSGRRRRAEILLGTVTERELFYDAELSGACYGDSGGPILQDFAGGAAVVGVTSRGSGLACDGTNVATRVDVFRAWLRE